MTPVDHFWLPTIRTSHPDCTYPGPPDGSASKSRSSKAQASLAGTPTTCPYLWPSHVGEYYSTMEYASATSGYAAKSLTSYHSYPIFLQTFGGWLFYMIYDNGGGAFSSSAWCLTVAKYNVWICLEAIQQQMRIEALKEHVIFFTHGGYDEEIITIDLMGFESGDVNPNNNTHGFSPEQCECKGIGYKFWICHATTGGLRYPTLRWNGVPYLQTCFE